MQQLVARYGWGQLVRFSFTWLLLHWGLILFGGVHPHQGCEGPSRHTCLRGRRSLLILIESLLRWRRLLLGSVFEPLGRVNLSQLQVGFTGPLEDGFGRVLGLQLALLV